MILHNHEQGSDEWRRCKLGVPSASNFSRLVTGTGKPSASLSDYAAELASEMYAGKTLDEFDGNIWMNRGRELEAEAISWLEFTRDIIIQRVGFCTLDDGSAGCSPDGLIGDDEGVECKCLKAERFIEVNTYFNKHGRCPPAYTAQVQGSLWVTGRARWTLLFYNRDLPPLAIAVTPDPAYHAQLAEAVRQVCKERDAVLASLRREQTEVPKGRDMLGAG